MPQQTPPIAPTELFARLAGGHAARVTVVTPNRRLAQSLQREFDRLQLTAGHASWEAPDILPFATFLARCHEDARFAPGGETVPTLLSDAEAQVLWEDALRKAGAAERILSIPATAALAGEAWDLAHEWRIAGALDGTADTDDGEAFAAWRRAYARGVGSQLDRARLAQWVAAA